MPPSLDRVPTLRAVWLGQELRKLRDMNRVSSREMASYLGKSQATVSRIESGLYPPKEEDVKAYLDLCQVGDRTTKDNLFAMCEEVSQRGWWDGYERDVANSVIDRMWIEARAREIKTSDLTYIPSLLQTPEYAEAICRAGRPQASDQQIKRWREFRMTRQLIVSGHNPIRLSCLMNSGLLKRKESSKEVMKAQLDYILSCTKRENVQVRLLAEDAWYGDGSFELLELAEPYPKIGYVLTPVGDICVEGDKADLLAQTYDRLLGGALSLTASRKLITAARDAL